MRKTGKLEMMSLFFEVKIFVAAIEKIGVLKTAVDKLLLLIYASLLIDKLTKAGSVHSNGTIIIKG